MKEDCGWQYVGLLGQCSRGNSKCVLIIFPTVLSPAVSLRSGQFGTVTGCYCKHLFNNITQHSTALLWDKGTLYSSKGILRRQKMSLMFRCIIVQENDSGNLFLVKLGASCIFLSLSGTEEKLDFFCKSSGQKTILKN